MERYFEGYIDRYVFRILIDRRHSTIWDGQRRANKSGAYSLGHTVLGTSVDRHAAVERAISAVDEVFACRVPWKTTLTKEGSPTLIPR